MGVAYKTLKKGLVWRLCVNTAGIRISHNPHVIACKPSEKGLAWWLHANSSETLFQNKFLCWNHVKCSGLHSKSYFYAPLSRDVMGVSSFKK